MSYDRYKKFRKNGTVSKVPFILITVKDSDKYISYEAGKTRFDILSYQFYNDPNYEWLILQANPEYGCREFLIPNGARLRIPYPLDVTLRQYENDIDTYMQLYTVN